MRRQTPEHIARKRAAGLALVEEGGDLTDAAMPAEGTSAHVTLLVADFLAGAGQAGRCVPDADVAAFIRTAAPVYGRYWRKAAREPGAETELARDALAKLAMLRLIQRDADGARGLPALARFSLGDTTLIARPATPGATDNNTADNQANLF